MGIFSQAKKVVKKVVNGVKKQFKKVMAGVVKFMNSKIGKIIMIAASVVTAGAALYGAYMGAAGAIQGLGAAGGGNFLSTFGQGAMGALKGAQAGMGLANKAMGQAVLGNFSGAGATMGTIGAEASAAGNALTATAGLGDAASNVSAGVADTAASSVVSPESALQGNAVVGGGAGPAGPAAGFGGTGAATPTGTLDLAKGLTPELGGTAGTAAGGSASTFTTPAQTFGQKLTTGLTSGDGLLAVGKMVGTGATSLQNYLAAKEAEKEEKKLLENGIYGRDGTNINLMGALGYGPRTA